jgi:hypothetical protein
MMRYRIPAGIASATLLIAQLVVRGSTAYVEIHPIVELREQCLIGGVQDQKWVPPARFEKTLRSPQNFNLYTLGGPAGEILLTKNAESECHPRWSAKSTPKLNDGIAIQSPSWNVMPRVPKPIDSDDPAYVQIVSDILKAAGISKPEVKITQAYSVDLDGDGNQEVVIVANHFAHGLRELSGISTQTSPGDYTLVFVRKTVNGKVENIFIVKAIWLKAGTSVLPRANHLSAIADLNGDGIMELVLYNAYYEGSASDVLQVKGSKVTGVLSCSCEH